MLDTDLKERMEAAYLWGDKELALELSQQLDMQIAEEQKTLGREIKLCGNG